MSTSKFVNALDELQPHLNGLVPGENGALSQSTTSSLLLDLFFKLVRNLSEEDLKNSVSNILTFVKKNEDVSLLADLFVLMFQTRDCRCGKGEKNLFYLLFFSLFKEYPVTIISLLGEIPYYGYFKDLLNIYQMNEVIQSELLKSTYDIFYYSYLELLKDKIIDFFALQLLKDKKELEDNSGIVPQLSFAAKYAPREGKKKFNIVYKKLVIKLFNTSNSPKEDYRKLIVSLTKALDVPEIFMCAKRYDEINFKKVPSLCLNRFRKAFLNELVTKKGNVPVPLSESEEDTGNRHPDDPKRVQCRKNLQLATVEGNV